MSGIISPSNHSRSNNVNEELFKKHPEAKTSLKEFPVFLGEDEE